MPAQVVKKVASKIQEKVAVKKVATKPAKEIKKAEVKKVAVKAAPKVAPKLVKKPAVKKPVQQDSDSSESEDDYDPKGHSDYLRVLAKARGVDADDFSDSDGGSETESFDDSDSE